MMKYCKKTSFTSIYRKQGWQIQAIFKIYKKRKKPLVSTDVMKSSKHYLSFQKNKINLSSKLCHLIYRGKLVSDKKRFNFCSFRTNKDELKTLANCQESLSQPQRSQPLTSYFCQGVPSQLFEKALNTPLSQLL